MNIEIRQKDDNTSWEELANLFHEAFQERLDQGLHFICSDFTPDYLKRQSANDIILLAFDTENETLAGAAFVRILHNKNDTWGYLSNMAIKPNYKRKGIGSKLESKRIEIAKSNGCSYVLADTAVGAKSSVDWHLKNGFRIIQMISWSNTNYYSYNFRKQLKPHPLWSNSCFCRIHFWLSALRCKLLHRENGEYTVFAQYLLCLKKLLFNSN